MTAEGPWEIPPLDGAADIARTTETQPGEALADARNWSGFVLLLSGLCAAIAAAVCTGFGWLGIALGCAMIAVAAFVGGAVLVFVEFRRKRPAAERPAEGGLDAGQRVVPPRI